MVCPDEDVVSAGVPSDLRVMLEKVKKRKLENRFFFQKLSQKISELDSASNFLELNPMEAVEWLKKSSPEVAKMYDGFIKKFGHRCLREVMQLFFLKKKKSFSRIFFSLV